MRWQRRQGEIRKCRLSTSFNPFAEGAEISPTAETGAVS